MKTRKSLRRLYLEDIGKIFFSKWNVLGKNRFAKSNLEMWKGLSKMNDEGSEKEISSKI